MTDSDSEFRIRAVIDPTGAEAGAAQAVAGLEKITAATGEVAGVSAAAAAATAEAADVASLYGVSLETAQRALTILGAASGEATANFAELDAAMDLAQEQMRAAATANAAYTASMRESAAATIAQARAEEELGTLSAAATRALVALGIAQKDVAATATEMGISTEIAARAMIQIKQAQIADSIAAARAQIEAMTPATLDATAAQEALAAAETETANVGTMKFGRGSPMFHAMVATSNISRGGAIAMRGWMEAAELVGVAFGNMLGPIILVGAVVGELIERYDEHNQKVDEAGNKVGEFKDQVKGGLEEAGGDVRTYKEVWKDALDEVLKAQEQLEKSDARQLTAIKEKGIAEKAVIAVQKEAAIEQARAAYLAKLTPDMSAEDRKKAKDDFEAQKSDITNESDVATAKLAVTTKQAEIAQLQKALADEQTDLADLTLKLRQATEAKVTAANALANLGITFATDKDGAMKFTDFDGNDVTAGSQKKIHDLLDLINNQRGIQNQAGGPGKRPEIDSYLARLTAQLTSEEEFQNSLVLYARDIQNFGAARDSLGKSIETDKGKIEDTTGKIDDARQQLGIMTQKVPVAQQKAENDKKERDADQAMQAYHDAVKTKYDDARAKLEARRKDLETGEDDPNLNPEQRAQLKAQIDGLDAQLAQLQLDNAKGLGLTNADQIGLRADIKNDRQKAVFDLAGGQKKANAQASEADKKQTQEQIESVRGEIEATGNKDLIQALHRIMETVLDKHLELLEMQELFAAAASGKFQQMDHRIDAVNHISNSLRNNGQS